jgi:hypothetical protein
MTIAVCILLAEAQGTTELVIPMCIVSLIARSISKYFGGESVDHFQVHAKNLFYLHEKPPAVFCVSTARDLMEPFWRAVPIKISPLGALMFLDQNDQNRQFQALPVVMPSGRLCGLVSTRLMRQAAFNSGALAQNANTALLSLHSFAEVVVVLLTNMELKERVKHTNRDLDKQERLEASQELGKALANKDEELAEQQFSIMHARDLKAGLTGATGNLEEEKERRLQQSTPNHHFLRKIRRPSDGSSSLAKFPKRSSESDHEKHARLYRRSRRFFFAISKEVNVANLMDSAPFFFLENTPIERIYSAFVKMNLAMVVIVTGDMKPVGLIRRKQLVEYMKTGKGLKSDESGAVEGMLGKELRTKIKRMSAVNLENRMSPRKKVHPLGDNAVTRIREICDDGEDSNW